MSFNYKDNMNIVDVAIKAHMDNNCFASFLKIDKFNGGMLEIPASVLYKKAAIKCVYEIDNDSVNIYINGTKDKSIQCPLYACRPLVAVDIVLRMTHMNLTPFLLKITSNNEDVALGEILQTRTAADLLDAPEKRNKSLEDKLYSSIETLYQSGRIDVHESVLPGFDIIQSHYNGEVNVTT